MTDAPLVPKKPSPNDAIGDDPFADMQPVEWLELAEEPEIEEEEIPAPPPAPPFLMEVKDEADAALVMWLNQDNNTDTTAESDSEPETELLEWLLNTAAQSEEVEDQK